VNYEWLILHWNQFVICFDEGNSSVGGRVGIPKARRFFGGRVRLPAIVVRLQKNLKVYIPDCVPHCWGIGMLTTMRRTNEDKEST
jgi:hypothetical protein